MDKQTIATSMTPEVFIDEVLGDLQVKGWEQSEVAVNADSDELDLVQEADTIRISCQGDCLVRVPLGATVRVGSVNGDGHFKLLQAPLSIENVHGSMILRETAAVSVENVYGELSARQVDGDLRAEQVYGNADIREVQGGYWGDIKGNLELRNVTGSLEAAAEGNARLRLENMAGSKYQITAGGNLHVSIPEEASLQLSLSSRARVVKVKLPDGAKTYQEAQVELTLGGGEVPATLEAGGVIYLFSQAGGIGDERVFAPVDFPEDYSQQIAKEVEAQIEAQMDVMTRQLDEQMARLTEAIGRSGLSAEQTERIIESARQARERSTARTQETVRRAQEKLERKLEAAQRRAELKAQGTDRRTQSRGRHSWSFEWPTPPTPPKPPVQPVSDDERLMILRMLEQKKISLEQAETLLAALEGRQSE